MQKEAFVCKTCDTYMMQPYFTGIDGEFVVPVLYCGSLQKYCRMFKEVYGEKYQEITGRKPSEVVYKKTIRLGHLNAEENQPEDMERHAFGWFDCWTDL